MSPHKTFINPFDGRPIRHPDTGGGGGGIVSAFRQDVVYAASDGQSNFTLSATPITNSEIVARNGQILTKGVGEDYTISGAVITLAADVASTIKAGEKISAHYAV